MKWSKFLYVALLGLLLVPGHALGEVYLNLIHPGTVTVGDTFTVTVDLVITDQPPNDVCGYQYYITYDDNKVLVAPNQFQAPVTPEMDGQFFARNNCNPLYPLESCTLPGFPEALNCCNTTLPSCAPAHFGFFDGTNFVYEDPNFIYLDPQLTPIPLPGRTTANWKFTALAPGCFDFAILPPPACPSVTVDCILGDDSISRVENGRLCVTAPPPPHPIPALNDFGVLFSALGLVVCALILVRRYIRIGR
jgi:hypothetical protein